MSAYITRTYMRLLWVTSGSLPDALRKLADELEERGVGDDVIDLHFAISTDDEQAYSVGAYLEGPL